MHFFRSVLKWTCPSVVVGAAFLACSPTNTTVQGPPIACEDSICTTGNACITGFNSGDDEAADGGTADGGKTLTCRLICDLDPKNPADFNSNGVQLRSAQDKCPPNFHCSAGGVEDAEAGGATVSYCVPNKASATFTPGKGQWGAPCNPQNGFSNNTDCDTANSFWCYAAAPEDAQAICTQFQCTTDLDCAGGYWCATINSAPNAKTLNRTIGMTTTVCLPRAWSLWEGSYCSPCATDIDCPLNNGLPQHCVGADGMAGAEKICAAECGSDKNCNLDNKCINPAESNVTAKVCVPRAATCKGDGSLCAPCRSDTDCPMGLCANADYSTERYCTVKSTVPCGTGQCPPKPTAPPVKGVGCYTMGTLKDQCTGEVNLMGNPISGCWTVNR